MVVTRGHSKFKVGDNVLCQSASDSQSYRSAKVIDVVDRGLVDGKRHVDFHVRVEDDESVYDRCVTEDELLDADHTDSNTSRTSVSQNETIGGSGSDRAKSSSVNTKPVQARSSTEMDTAPSLVLGAEDSETNVSAICQHISIDGDTSEFTASLNVPLFVRKWLDKDHSMLRQRKLISLPAKVSVCDILERYVHFWSTTLVPSSTTSAPSNLTTPTSATTSAQPTGSGRNRQSSTRDPWWQAAVISHSLCVEIVDGLRILFDFVCQLRLLYKCERGQYNRLVVGRASEKMGGVCKVVGGVKSEMGGASVEKNSDSTQSVHSAAPVSTVTCAVKRRSQRLSMLAQSLSAEVSDNVSVDSEKTDRQGREPLEQQDSTGTTTGKRSSLDKESSAHLPDKNPRLQGRDCSLLDGDVIPSGCCLLPDDERTRLPRYPSTIYGATHLLRLLVSLPSLLSEMQLPESRLKLVLYHGRLLLEFIARCRSQWLTPDQYSNN